MLRKYMMSFEDMEKLEGCVDSDYENICYRIEDGCINWLKEEEERPQAPVMEYNIFDIMTDCYDVKRIGAHRTEQYYSEEDNKVYEITYDCISYDIIEINIRKAKPGEAKKEHVLDDIKDYVV